MKKVLVILAHHDDETIFLSSTIKHFKDIGYEIDLVIVTDVKYQKTIYMKDKKTSFKKVCDILKIDRIFELNFENHRLENCHDIIKLKRELNKFKLYDIVITHNENGEYGHYMHTFVHKVVKDVFINYKLYFISKEKTDFVFSVDKQFKENLLIQYTSSWEKVLKCLKWEQQMDEEYLLENKEDNLIDNWVKVYKLSKQIKLIFDFLELNKHLIHNKYLLDVGCGSGNTMRTLKKRFGVDDDLLYGCDIERGHVRLSYNLTNNKNISLCDFSQKEIEYEDGFFDVIFAIGWIHCDWKHSYYLSQDKTEKQEQGEYITNIFMNLDRILKKDGYIFFDFCNQNHYSGKHFFNIVNNIIKDRYEYINVDRFKMIRKIK